MIQNNQRKVYFDVMRIIATFLVIFNHMGGYSLYMQADGVKQILYLICTKVTRINVPLFFMMSGALLLGKEESWSEVLKKRVLRFGLVLAGFSLAYLALQCFMSWIYTGTFEVALGKYIRNMISGSVRGLRLYWYLYSYLGMLLMLPFLRKIAKHMTGKDVIALLVMHFVLSSLLPGVNRLLEYSGRDPIGLSSDLSVPLVTLRQLFYPLLGYYLDKTLDIKAVKPRHLAAMGAACVACIAIFALCTIQEGETKGYTQNYVMMFDYVLTIFAFVGIKWLFTQKIHIEGTKLGNGICFVGSLTFGIYLLDQFLKYCFLAPIEQTLEPMMPTIIFSVLWCLISMVVGGVLTFLLKQIPGIKKAI